MPVPANTEHEAKREAEAPCACKRRTCRNASAVPGVFVCSECGARTEARVIPPAQAADAAVRKLCAHLRIDPQTVCSSAPHGAPIAYCPYCGAKVAPTVVAATGEGDR